jgi:hypothetical protein
MSGRWVDLREAAELLGTSTEAVRKRATRGSLRSDRHEGRVVVWVDDDRTEGGRQAQGEHGALVEALAEQVAYLREQLDIRTEELREHRRLLAGLIERVPELEAPVQQEPASQTSEEPPQAPSPGPEMVDPRSEEIGAQNGSQEPRSWWQRWFGG